jgi:aspartyl-tRNA(Asn)/glutamyl-tRNA(Gln) amidotransferase subunit C
MKKGVEEKIITEEVVRYVAGLSRLRLAEKDVARFRTQLSRILDYITQLDEVDTEGILPTTHVLSSMKNVFREDKLKESLSPEKALSNAPARKENFFKVPKVVKDI